MALVRFGNGVTEIRGSIAGNVYSRTRAGAIIRNRTVPVDQPTLLQAMRRSNFNTIVQDYRQLTAAQRLTWQTFANNSTRQNRLGENYTPSAIQTFMEIVLNLSLLSLPSLLIAPADPVRPDVTSLTIPILDAFAGTLNEITITYNGSLGSRIVIEATPPLTPSIQNTQNYFRYLLTTATNAGTGVDILTPYLMRYGPVLGGIGQEIAVRGRAVKITNGLSSPWLYARQVIVAA